MDTNEITRHRRTGGSANPGLIIIAVPKPGVDGQPGHCHNYELRGEDRAFSLMVLQFQDGPPADVGINGVTEEALIAIIIDRLERFNAGPYRCRQNSLAITKLEEAMMWLGDRTAERTERGVEGTLEP